MLVVNQVYSI